MVKLAEYSRTATFAWSRNKIPTLVTGTASGTVDADFSSDSTLELWSLLSTDKLNPVVSVEANAKFNDIDWSIDNKYIAGALDNGMVELFKTNSKDTLKSIKKLSKHGTSVTTVNFNAKQENVLASGSKNGEIFIWDLNKCIDQSNDSYSPLTPGMAMTPVEEITSLAWNQSLSHVFASAGNTSYASIWDLKAKKEVIHLSYTSPSSSLKPQLSVVEWHPENSTRVATASNSDNEPIILIWDLRNANTPLQILENGNSKGILSLDWCKHDSNLLLSSGRDNTAVLWNPEEGKELTQYPSRSNWCFKTKFAPEAPDLFACASFDGKVEIQTLQNLTNNFDKEENATKQKESETDFWNNVSNEQSNEKPTIFNIQAPNWYGNKSPAASWAFGGKLVQITPDGKGVSITKPELPGLQLNSLLDEAIKSKDFSSIINQRLTKTINDINEEDWNMLEKLSVDGKDIFLKESLQFDDEEEDEEEDEDEAVKKSGKEKKEIDEGELFFAQVESKYQPKGKFKLGKELDQTIANNLIKKNYKSAVMSTLKDDSLLEAMIIAMDSNDESLKESVKQAYFTKYAEKSSLSRFLYSISEKNMDDLVDNLDVSQWKYVAKSILTYCDDDTTKRNELLIKLGDRLLDEDSRQDAIILYLSANSIDKIASIWVNEFKSLEENVLQKKDTAYEAHSETLSEFVERFTVFSSFVGSNLSITNEDLISKFMEFVNITSATGNFDLAYTFLETLPSDNADVITEKERVLLASGKSVAKKATPTTAATTVTGRSASNKATPTLPGLPNNSHPNAAKRPLYGGLPSNTSINSAYAPVTPNTSVFSPNAPPTQAFPFPNTQPTSMLGSQPMSPIVNKPNPYTPAVPTAPIPSANTRTGSANGSSKYAPPQGSNTPTNYYEPQKASVPASTSSPVNNPYAPPPNFIHQANPLKNINEFTAPPPQNGKSGASGQTPHLNKKANFGWNDLPIGKDATQAKPSRAKAVSIQPSNSGTPSPGVYGNANASSMVGPPVSRHASNTMPHAFPPPAKSSRKASLNNSTVSTPNISQAPSHSTSAYAPQEQLPVSSPNTRPIMPTQPYTNPYAPSAAANPLPQPPTNPYAPSASSNAATPGVAIPVNPYATNSNGMGSAPPQRTTQRPSGPPPINARKKKEDALPPPPPQSTSVPISTPPSTTTPIASTASAAVGELVEEKQELTEKEQEIVDFFTEELKRVSPLIPQEYSKQLKDCKKRLNILFDHLRKKDLLTDVTIDKLTEIFKLMKQQKYSESMELYVDIATNHAHEGGNWLTGVKRLIGIAEATKN
ncbi:hypothetical protein TBLA_0F02140 [Henningerozyma blattae CBS 6284]|uniref:Protein transport protein SEC31 n=1 Tax=Henningerozyma blattae (strain ATCC 34711 / CBS 6284 / DSM 70876 / NBRC 10599 / NRRL Y-10934 / UCD 77-7) TaxID=1071380 RepID=I2H5V4_HENB6|nr:hypothetical protein TBLA_0F02140 [Tetrapisispora blattae CBS 6284]CCH61756.1 hypothetical protein TBLA_0F02140 [Tetrapisispora blattae CBS 6284]